MTAQASSAALALALQTETDMHRLERLVKLWATQTFGGPERVTPNLLHMGEEHDELVRAAEAGDPAALAEEAADVLILLMGLAGHAGFDLTGAFKAKMLHNLRERKWLPPDGQGIIRHAKDGGDPSGESAAPTGAGEAG